jgi:hypothetical protein
MAHNPRDGCNQTITKVEGNGSSVLMPEYVYVKYFLLLLFKLQMNPIIKDESLLSSISNISVLIKPNDGSSVFNFSMLPDRYEPEPSLRPCEVKL